MRDRVVPRGAGAVWLTSCSPQLGELDGERTVLVHDAGQRDVANVARNAPAVARSLRRYRPVAVVSTGAALALSALPVARALGVEVHYLESAARTQGPSVTGRLLSKVPGVHCYTQWPSWAGGRWGYAGSVFDGLVVEPSVGPPRPLKRLVVTVGTQRGYGFRRLIERLLEVVPAQVKIFWQAREKDTASLGVSARSLVPAGELAAEIQAADAVVCHAGIGSAVFALRLGKCPLLVPREARYGEHVDDHQSLIGAELGRNGLALVRKVDQLQLADLETAANRVVRYEATPMLPLRGRLGVLLAREGLEKGLEKGLGVLQREPAQLLA